MSSQSEVSRLSIELVQGVTHLARSLVAAARNWTLYPPEHPATKASFERLSHAIQQATNDAVFSVGITPDTLLIEGRPVPPSAPVAERRLKASEEALEDFAERVFTARER